MSSIAQILGQDPMDPIYQAATDLVEADWTLIQDLKTQRRAREMTRQDVARIMGVKTSDVERIENRGSETIALSTLRRYALAVGARVTHYVENDPRVDWTKAGVR